ncbi:MAG: ABC transporter ATP-binding protein [Calditrichaeota bacterium]|nr:MAG: ABC transporter ATP-binding protein [Calditrichota bacterium]
MSEPIIQVRDLVARYGDRTILKGVSLDIYKGESIAILGRSGCGKSTFLRHMIGLATPASGQIIIKGKDITKLTPEERVEILKRLGMLFQSSALFNSMTLADNVALPLREHTKLEESVIRIITKMKLEQVGLSGFEDFKPSQLSGGMRKRAGLARAIAMDPEILFCDEPSAGLDPVVAAGIDNLILKLKKAFKMTIVVVTHELDSVFTIADRIAMMHDGKIIAVGTQEEFKQNTNPIVQQFLKRVPDDEEVDRERYLSTLMESP